MLTVYLSREQMWNNVQYIVHAATSVVTDEEDNERTRWVVSAP